MPPLDPARSSAVFKRVAVAACVAALIAVGAWMFWPRPAGVAAGPTDALPEGTSLTVPPASIDAAPVAPVLPKPMALWQPIPVADVQPVDLPAYKEEVAGRVLVQLAQDLGGWAVGDRIAIAIPQLEATYAPEVLRVARGPGSIRTYAGTLLTADARDYSFVVTVSARNTFAHLSTPQGIYELVGDDRFGWLMPQANMDTHVDQTVPDYRPAVARSPAGL